MTALLAIEELTIEFPVGGGWVPAVRGLSLEVGRGEAVGLVGESGCGKTLTSLAVLRLLPSPGRIAGGRITFDGVDLLGLQAKALERVRGARIAMIFQEPMSALNPVYTIGFQIAEAVRAHRGSSRAEARDESERLLGLVAMPDPRQRLGDYPHQLSGGQRQRVMIAMALASRPELLIADEPTTALDVTLQAEILELLRSLRRQLDLSVLLITHDLAVVAEATDRVAVMYAGRVVEQATTEQLFDSPAHPYSRSLLAAVPRLGSRRSPGGLREIPGQVPRIQDLPVGCAFHPRCGDVLERCRESEPEMVPLVTDRSCRCFLHLGDEAGEDRS